MDNVLVVIITNSSTEFLVVHLGFVLSSAPVLGHLIRVGHLELPPITRPPYATVKLPIRQEFQ